MEVRNEIELGAALRTRRKQAGLTQSELAVRSGVSRAFIIDIEKGRRTRAEVGRILAVIKSLGASIKLVDDSPDSFDDALDKILR